MPPQVARPPFPPNNMRPPWGERPPMPPQDFTPTQFPPAPPQFSPAQFSPEPFPLTLPQFPPAPPQCFVNAGMGMPQPAMPTFMPALPMMGASAPQPCSTPQVVYVYVPYGVMPDAPMSEFGQMPAPRSRDPKPEGEYGGRYGDRPEGPGPRGPRPEGEYGRPGPCGIRPEWKPEKDNYDKPQGHYQGGRYVGGAYDGKEINHAHIGNYASAEIDTEDETVTNTQLDAQTPAHAEVENASASAVDTPVENEE